MTRFKISGFAFSVLFLSLILSLTACDRPFSSVPASLPATGLVMDAASNKPLAGAIITLDGKELLQTRPGGTFSIKSGTRRIAARAHGYTRAEQAIDIRKGAAPVEIRLNPITPQGALSDRLRDRQQEPEGIRPESDRND